GPAAYLAQRAAALPGGRLVGRALGARGGGWARRQVRWRGDVLPAEEGDALWADVDALAAACPGDDPTGCALWLDRRLGLAEGALAVVDATCGAHGIAHRAPLADPDLVKLVAQIPVGHLVQVRRPRGLFEEAMAERLPDPPKHAPMALPFAAWLARGALPDDLAERLDGLADPDGTRRLVADFRAGRPGLAGRLWSLQMLARWRMG
ncbi:MAG: asparagine synthase-related protein, partial [Myxococcota bacterium]